MRAKVNRNEFLDMVTQSLPCFTDEGVKLSQADVRTVYDALVSKIKEIVVSGQDLSLTGFGSFTLKKHKGHPVQFEANEDSVDDYVVLKFTASDVLMNSIRTAFKECGTQLPDDSEE